MLEAVPRRELGTGTEIPAHARFRVEGEVQTSRFRYWGVARVGDDPGTGTDRPRHELRERHLHLESSRSYAEADGGGRHNPRHVGLRLRGHRST